MIECNALIQRSFAACAQFHRQSIIEFLKHEVKIDALLAILLALAPVGYENLDLPHSKAVGFVAAIVCLVLLIRIAWILMRRTTVPFKNASEFSWWRRQVIKHDISGIREYFVSLDIPVPEGMPPLTFSDQNQGTYTPPQAYRGELIIPRPEVRNRKAVTEGVAERGHARQRGVPHHIRLERGEGQWQQFLAFKLAFPV